MEVPLLRITRRINEDIRKMGLYRHGGNGGVSHYIADNFSIWFSFKSPDLTVVRFVNQPPTSSSVTPFSHDDNLVPGARIDPAIVNQFIQRRSICRMSSRGQPSKGCTKCRARKVKCDRTSPVCERCQKIGNTACIYRDQFEVRLRDQTSRVAEKAQEKWRSRAKRAASVDEPLIQIHDTAQILVSPPDALEDFVYQRFCHDWIIPRDPEQPQFGIQFMEFLPELYSKTPPGSALSAAMAAIAYSNYAQRCKRPEFLPRAIKSSSVAMALLKGAMENPKEAFLDDTLAVVNVLGIYEVRSRS